jgi:hypothetical protein
MILVVFCHRPAKGYMKKSTENWQIDVPVTLNPGDAVGYPQFSGRLEYLNFKTRRTKMIMLAEQTDKLKEKCKTQVRMK